MGIFSSKHDENVAKLQEAREDLAELGPHHTDMESAEYLRRNRAVYDAEKALPWWRR